MLAGAMVPTGATLGNPQVGTKCGRVEGKILMQDFSSYHIDDEGQPMIPNKPKKYFATTIWGQQARVIKKKNRIQDCFHMVSCQLKENAYDCPS